MAFYKEAAKWFELDVLRTFTKQLKKAQHEEIEKFVSEIDRSQPAVPLRQSEAEIAELQKASGTPAFQLKPVDAYDLVEAVDVLKPFGDKWCDKLLAQQKWKEKCDLLEELIKAISVPKIVA